MPISKRYETSLLENFSNYDRLNQVRPIVLGATAGSGGGFGGRPGGFIGQLHQTKVAFDKTEAAISGIPIDYSGVSLLDNLNRIRYRLGNLETTLSGGISVKEYGEFVSANVTVLDFVGSVSLQKMNPNEVRVTIAVSGGQGFVSRDVYGEDLSSQINGVTTTFNTINKIEDDHLEVYYNGIRQGTGNITILSGGYGFTTNFIPVIDDELFVDYQVLTSGFVSGIIEHGRLLDLDLDHHLQYLTSGRGTDLFYVKPYIDALFYQTIGNDTFTAAGEIIVGSGAGTASLLPIGDQGQVLTVFSGQPLKVAWDHKRINQQILFSIEGENLTVSDTGVKPLRIYMHDVGNNSYIEEVFCALDTAPSNQPLRINILKNGGTIFDSPEYIQLNVDSHTATSSNNFLDPYLGKDDYLQMELVQGDQSAANLTVHIRLSWEL